MIYLVGDVQGCAEALERLLAAIDFSPSRARLVLLGDLVNRGPASLAVLRRVAGLGSAATCVLGNHDLHLLAVAHGVRAQQRGDTFGDVLADTGAAHWVEWLRHQALAHQEADWLCVHAGVAPQWTLAQTLAIAGEVQDLLRGGACGEFLRQMYGNEPLHWADATSAIERARFAVNALTRMRFCSARGELELKNKEGAQGAPEGYMPWFDVPGRQTANERIAFGHWSTLGLINRADLLALDTGCVWGGQLTAVRVDGGRREVLQVKCQAAQTPGL
jgi:bis(5'-nucleosyl)-tetraphosphatase (symmetrical)